MSTAANDPIATSPGDCPTETIPAVGHIPTRRSIFPKGACPAPTATLPAVTLPTAAGADWRGQALTEELEAAPAPAPAPAPRSPGRTLRHLRHALVGTLLAAALLTGLQLYAAAGISDARQAALAARSERDTSQVGQTPAPTADRPNVRTDIQPAWAAEDTGAPYSKDDPAPSPLDLPRCTTSPDTPLPCLATISPSQDRAVVLEEDASLTALVRR